VKKNWFHENLKPCLATSYNVTVTHEENAVGLVEI